MQFCIPKGKGLNQRTDYVFWQTEWECQNIMIIYIGRYSMPTITTQQNIAGGPIRVCKVSDKIYINLDFRQMIDILRINSLRYVSQISARRSVILGSDTSDRRTRVFILCTIIDYLSPNICFQYSIQFFNLRRTDTSELNIFG